ncbi:MAG: DUF6106 family protein [Eubacteriales bacterium]|nr:DUF6106 family protein [Eubacteriales bacterium]
MSDLYSELLVKKEPTAKDAIIKYGLIGVTAIFAFGGLFIHPLLLFGAIGLGIACYFIVPKTSLEFDYLFVNGELDITRVMSQSKRDKKSTNISLSEADLVAPVNSHRMDYYNGNQKMKVYDFSSGNKDHKRFAIITRLNGENCKVIIEPDEALAHAMKNSAPSKVFLD